ncbi:LacI family DNA-binding transcriptional regulator [Leucobacter chromiiresistens]|uniref:DNA-binding transcriptional regulator, LacI/PurR family n=3 Tax=Leucobacter chromiiresistens TaxID=1079994 RepID=A0A1H0Y6T1_9MICO|nr:LacI family DNA-binding transcriptional regulator [Leucobacter chromiiresistens]SDQ10781.1 DNA-binding transcriptional regulator, LacI/PurR family [Leucobacter chromiiresistens]
MVHDTSATPGGPVRSPTIRDVARVAGVSKSLVSLVFTGGGTVSEERRLRVLHAAEQLGYRPNLVAQSLSAGRRDIVAILVSNLHNPLFAEIVGAAKARLAEAGRRTMILSAQVDDGAGGAVLDRDNIDVLRDLRPSGLIAVGTIPEFAELAELTAAIPTVVASAIDATPDVVAAVRTDDAAGLDLVVAHLAAQGVERVAFVGGDGGTVAAARERAFVAAAERRGFGARAWVERADSSDAGARDAAVAARRAVARLLAEDRLPQAIVAVNDVTAVGVITALESAGVGVPRGCRVVGYDGTTLAAIPRISLTTVDPDNRRIGREAAEALLAAPGFAAPGVAAPWRQGADRAGAESMSADRAGAGSMGAGDRSSGEVLIPPTLVVRASA